MEWEDADAADEGAAPRAAAVRRRPAAAAAAGSRGRVATKFRRPSDKTPRASRDTRRRASRVMDLKFPVQLPVGVREPLPTEALLVGSDCAGLLTEGLALDILGVGHMVKFISEKDPAVRHLIYNVYGKTMIVYKDCGVREMADVPRVHLYVFGFPCQPFSPAGKGQGLQDPRGEVIMHCLDYVRHKLPTLVLAENSARFACKRPPSNNCVCMVCAWCGHGVGMWACARCSFASRVCMVWAWWET